MDKTDELTAMLRALPDTYSDIVIALPIIARRYQITDELIEYLKKNKDATTSDVLEYEFDLKMKYGYPADGSKHRSNDEK